MDVKVGRFITDDNLGPYYNCWPTRDSQAPCAIYLHGLESHMGWFFNLAEYLNSRGINVYAFDRRGSGVNRDSCKNSRCSYLSSDTKIFLDLVKEEHPESRIFLIGLCLGGKIALSFATKYQDLIDGLILISPSLKSKLKFSLADKLSIVFRPNRMLKIPIKDRMFTSNEGRLKHIKNDAMRMHSIPAQHLLEIAKMDRYIKSALRTLRLPVLVMLAGVDEIIDTASVKKWYQKLPSDDKTLKIYKDFYHLLTFEKKAEECLEDITGWILKRASA